MLLKYFLSLLLVFVTASCSSSNGANPSPGSPSPSNPSPGNAIVYNGSSYPVSSGLADVYAETDNHYNIDFTVTDGYFVPLTTYVGDIPITIWNVAEAKAVFSAELYSPGQDAFRTGTFSYTPLTEDQVDDPSLAGTYFFNEAYAGFDTNGDNEVDEAEEIAVTGGSVTLAGVAPNFQLSFSVQLANGRTATGSYTGEFLLIDE